MQGDELRSARKVLNLTQAEFGKALGITAAYVGELERGEKTIDPRTAHAAMHLVERRTKLDISFNEQLGWLITLNSYEGNRRVHTVMKSKPTLEEAKEFANAVAERDFPHATVIVHMPRA